MTRTVHRPGLQAAAASSIPAAGRGILSKLLYVAMAQSCCQLEGVSGVSAQWRVLAVCSCTQLHAAQPTAVGLLHPSAVSAAGSAGHVCLQVSAAITCSAAARSGRCYGHMHAVGQAANDAQQGVSMEAGAGRAHATQGPSLLLHQPETHCCQQGRQGRTQVRQRGRSPSIFSPSPSPSPSIISWCA